MQSTDTEIAKVLGNKGKLQSGKQAAALYLSFLLARVTSIARVGLYITLTLTRGVSVEDNIMTIVTIYNMAKDYNMATY